MSRRNWKRKKSENCKQNVSTYHCIQAPCRHHYPFKTLGKCINWGRLEIGDVFWLGTFGSFGRFGDGDILQGRLGMIFGELTHLWVSGFKNFDSIQSKKGENVGIIFTNNLKDLCYGVTEVDTVCTSRDKFYTKRKQGITYGLTNPLPHYFKS